MGPLAITLLSFLRIDIYMNGGVFEFNYIEERFVNFIMVKL